jgi:hypothetical protein
MWYPRQVFSVKIPNLTDEAGSCTEKTSYWGKNIVEPFFLKLTLFLIPIIGSPGSSPDTMQEPTGSHL